MTGGDGRDSSTPVPVITRAPPLQPGVVGPYSVRGMWFPSHLPLERTKSYLFLGRNRRPAVPWVQDPTSIKLNQRSQIPLNSNQIQV
jgi:hypothetical protein